MSVNDYLVSPDKPDTQSHKMESWEKLIVVLAAVFISFLFIDVGICFSHLGEEGFHFEAMFITGILIDLCVNVIILNIWLLCHLVKKFTFFDHIESDCSKCKHLMCVRKNKKITYRCANQLCITRSNICKETQVFKPRKKDIPFDKFSYIRKYTLIASITSVCLIVLLLIFVPQAQNTGTKSEVFAYLSILCGIFCVFAIINTIMLWVKWWTYQHGDEVKCEEIIVSNEDDDGETNDTENDDYPADDSNENELIKTGTIILGKWIRENTVRLDKIAQPGICKCWVDREVLETILQHKEMSFDDMQNRLEIRKNQYCVYVGCTSNMKQRLKQHVNGSVSSSAFKRNLLTILNDEDLLVNIIDNTNFECIATEQGEQIKEDLLKKYYYILYQGK